MTHLFSDNAQTTLAAGITNTATSLSVLSGTGTQFPAITSGATDFIFTLVKNGNPTIFEICICTNRAGDTFTSIARAQENTTALTWNAGDTVTLLPTAAGMNSFLQASTGQAQAYNYAVDVGSANAYSVTLTPALSAHVVGMPIRILIGHTNTGNSTLNDGAGAAAIHYADGNNIAPGDLIAGGIYEFFWTGSVFELNRADTSLLAPIASPVFTGDPQAPTAAAGTSTQQLATTQFVNPGSSLGASGYRKNPDGSIDQWGVTTPGGSSVTVNFPLAFPNICWSITATAIGVFCDLHISQPSASATSFNLSLGASGTQISWRAIGN